MVGERSVRGSESRTHIDDINSYKLRCNGIPDFGVDHRYAYLRKMKRAQVSPITCRVGLAEVVLEGRTTWTSVSLIILLLKMTG